MKKNKIICLILITFLLFGCVNKKTTHTEQKINDYIEQITTLTEKLTEMTNKNEELEERIGKIEPEVLEEGECIFTNTYLVVDIMNYGTNDNETKFVVLDQFQVYEPFIVKLTKDQTSKLLKSKSYEFTFTGHKKNKNSKYNDLFLNYEITNIKESNRIGLDQLQESCR